MQYFALLWPKGKHNTYRNASNSSKSRQASFTLKHKHSTGTCHLSSAIIHDIPTEQRIKYKTSCLCYQVITGVPSRPLLSSSNDATFCIPTFKRKQKGGQAFCFSAVQTWNSLPFTLHHSPSLSAFKLSENPSFYTVFDQF